MNISPDRLRQFQRVQLALKAICDAWEKDGDIGVDKLAAARDAVNAAQKPDAPALHAGDLVRVELINTVYHGLVLGVEDDAADIFLGNGLRAFFPCLTVERVPLHFGSPCASNFAEILKKEPTMISDALLKAITDISRYQRDMPDCYEAVEAEINAVKRSMTALHIYLDIPDQDAESLDALRSIVLPGQRPS